MNQEWDGPSVDPLEADDKREAVYVGVDIETDDKVVSVAIGDESEEEWIQYEREPLSLSKCR